ncbi:MAG: heme biosynthesis protein HemY [Alphaproteobacteria bacterium]|nr:heme biosynthesis protein HemY [Alphaproteobacteria bacterium]
MIRLIFLVLVVLALGIGAAWLAEAPGRLALDWHGYRIETSAAAAVVLALAFAFAMALLYRFWLFVRQGPSAFGAARRETRRRKGYLALTRGMLAVASGDGRAARRLSAMAERLLEDRAPTLLLTAQAAELAGEQAQAERAYREMLERPETEFLGLRGLLTAAVRSGDRKAALDYARRAEALRPGTEWLLRERLALEAAAGDWEAAADTLERGAKRRALPEEVTQHQRAVIALQRAGQADAEGLEREALDWAVKAAKADPGFAAAQVEAARRLQVAGRVRKAARLLAAAWSRAPHPEVGRAYMELYSSEEAKRRWLRAEELVAGQLDHPESKALLAEATVAAGDAKAARPLVLALKAAEGETARVCRLMASVERAEWGDSQAAHDWAAKVPKAPEAGQWVCGACGHGASQWRPHCRNCQAFARLVWRGRAEEAGQAAPAAIPALPHSSSLAESA